MSLVHKKIICAGHFLHRIVFLDLVCTLQAQKNLQFPLHSIVKQNISKKIKATVFLSTVVTQMSYLKLYFKNYIYKRKTCLNICFMLYLLCIGIKMQMFNEIIF